MFCFLYLVFPGSMLSIGLFPSLPASYLLSFPLRTFCLCTAGTIIRLQMGLLKSRVRRQPWPASLWLLLHLDLVSFYLSLLCVAVTGGHICRIQQQAWLFSVQGSLLILTSSSHHFYVLSILSISSVSRPVPSMLETCW